MGRWQWYQWRVSCLLLLARLSDAGNAPVNEGGECLSGCVCRSPFSCQTHPQASWLPRACCNLGLVCCPLTGISKRKCEEHSRLAYSKAELVLHQVFGDVAASAPWSRAIPECAYAVAPLIIGGDLAAPGDVPHMALIGFDGSDYARDDVIHAGDDNGVRVSVEDVAVGKDDGGYSWLCGGALISERWVLTAAHCLAGHRGPPRRVRLGTWRRGVAVDGDAQEVGVDARVSHPRYRPPARYHDIGLLHLAAEPILSANVRPACLHTQFDIPASRAQASGYGRSSFDADNAGEALRSTWLSLVPRVECARHYREEMGSSALPDGMPRSVLCAGDLEGGRDTCQGDSGGPLQILTDRPYCSFTVIGVTSFGKFCGFPNSPGVYSRVSHYVPWIESVVWPDEIRRGLPLLSESRLS